MAKQLAEVVLGRDQLEKINRHIGCQYGLNGISVKTIGGRSPRDTLGLCHQHHLTRKS